MNVDEQQQTLWISQAAEVLDIEIAALEIQKTALNADFVAAASLILHLKGKLVLIGMGKSGIIARKIAATFASTGTPAFFVHAAEALHGDLGMITADDAVLALSHSGETDEVCGLLPTIKRLGAPMIAMTGKTSSTLAQHADYVLHIPVSEEACPMNLAPTASTTATLALGDALAVVVLKHRGIQPEDFARVHPAGSLGRRLKSVADVMQTREAVPMVALGTPLSEAIVTMSSYRLGITGVGEGDSLIGCLTDGDLRRVLQQGKVDMGQKVSTVMHSNPHSIAGNHLATEAVRYMEEKKVSVLFVTEHESLVGVVHLHDLLEAGIA
ncbi:MAG: KpsF/GutQ family sugar-phosphate isomerase [Mariprofundaceae bacterium]|nr:KpsF/GutQ family sugar-phosphate isomerase [Mariprofundaceae bacterium]